MVYGAEAVLPSDIRHDSPRVAAYTEAENEKARQDSLDLLDEERDLAAAHSAIYQQDLRRYHSRRVKTRTFQEGDLVLQLIQDQTDMHKLSPPWEGPFVVSKNLHNGSYYCRHSGNGGPQTCLSAACGVAQRGPSTAHLHQHGPKTLARGQASRGG